MARWKNVLSNPTRVSCSVVFGAFLSCQCHFAAADDPNGSIEPHVTRTPEELALEQQYADEQRIAALAFFDCLTKAKDSGFLGVGNEDPRAVCSNDREQYARYLPQDQAETLLDRYESMILNGTEAEQ